ncbi:hypothetical protein Ndes2526B_g00843 [Nannochloris sp. 'desiccata']
MEPEWSPKDYTWDAETLVATRQKESSPSMDFGASHKAGKNKKIRNRKNLPKVICQIDGCGLKLDAPYYRKYRVCQIHAKSPAVIISGQAVRFCQKCARFHDLGEFDLERRSCRLRLAEHNRRRRAMTSVRKPTGSANYESQDDSVPLSSYHTPSDSTTPSYISHRTATAMTDTERAQSLSSLPPDVAAAVANLPMDFNIDALLGPLASCLHSMNQIVPLQQEHFPQFPMQPPHHPAPLTDPDSMMISAKPFGSALNLSCNIAPQSTFIENPAFAPGPASAPQSIPGPDLTDDALAFLDADIFSDADLDLALAGILDPVVDPSLPPPPVYTSPDVVVRMSMKFFSCMPSDLPPTLREELEQTLQTSASMIEGYARPGCTHVTVDLRLPADVAARVEATPLDIILRALSKKLPNNQGLLVQLGKHVAAIKSGKNLGDVIDASGPRGPHVAALSRVCVSVDEAASIRVDLYGANIGRPGDLVLCRQHGEHVTVEMLDTPAWNMVVEKEEEEEHQENIAAAVVAEENEQELNGRGDDGGGTNSDADNEEEDDRSATGVLDVDYASSSVRSGTSSTSGWDPTQANGSTTSKAGCMPATSVRLLGLRCGVAEVEVQAGGAMSAPRPILVLPDAAAAAEVEQLACRARRALWLDAFLRDAGVVVSHICSEGAAARLPGDLVEALATRTSAYCMEAGCPALGRLLRRAQNALRRAIGSDDTASKMAEMLEGTAKEKVERHLAAEGDGDTTTTVGVGQALADGFVASTGIPLIEDFKGLTVTAAANQNKGQGWKSLASISLGCAAVAVAAQLFRG